MPEYRLRGGLKVVAQLVAGEDENYVYLMQVVMQNADGSQTYYYRYPLRKTDLEEEAITEEKQDVAPAEEKPVEPEVRVERPRRRTRK